MFISYHAYPKFMQDSNFFAKKSSQHLIQDLHNTSCLATRSHLTCEEGLFFMSFPINWYCKLDIGMQEPKPHPKF